MVGDRVTVVFHHGLGVPKLYPAFVTAVYDTGFTCEPHPDNPVAVWGGRMLSRMFIERGVTWCNGVSGPEWEALKVMEALR